MSKYLETPAIGRRCFRVPETQARIGERSRQSVTQYVPHSRKRTPEEIGAEGERRVVALLAKSEVTALHNIIVHGKRGLTEIDHLVLTTSCIFVIETKNYSGSIEGDPDNERWTIAYEEKEVSVYNPIRQNKGHLRAVRHIVADRSVNLESLVAMVGDAELSDEIWTAKPVVDLEQLYVQVQRANEDTPGLSDAILAAWARIEAAARRGEPFRAQHTAAVRAAKAAWG